MKINCSKIIFFIMTLLSTQKVWSQGLEFKGKVIKYKENTGLGHVQIIVNGTSVKTSDDGIFIAKCNTCKPGQQIQIEFVRNRYEMAYYKKKIIEYPYPRDWKNTIVFEMCATGHCPVDEKAKTVKNFFKKREEDFQRKYEISEGELKERYEDSMTDLRKQFRNVDLEALAYSISEGLVYAKFGDTSEVMKKALRFINVGNFEKAERVLQENNPRSKISEGKKKKKEGKKIIRIGEKADSIGEIKLRQGIDETLQLARLNVANLHWDNANINFKAAFEGDTLNFDNGFEYASFLQKQNKHDKSLYYYLSVKKLSTKSIDSAMLLNNIGHLYYLKNNYPAAEKAFLEALEIYRKLVLTNPAAYTSELAGTLSNIGVLYQAMENYPAADTAHLEALEFYRKLARDNPAIYNPDLAITLSNIGGLYYLKNNSPAAEKAYLEALELRRKLVRDNPATYTPDLAMTLNNIGNLYRVEEDYPEAKKILLEALEVRRKLAKDNPAAYTSNLAVTLNNVGALYQAMENYHVAKKAHLEALEIYRKLAKDNPATYTPDLAMTLNNIGSLYQAIENYPAADKAHLEALEIYRKLAESNPAIYNPDVAMTLNNIGISYAAEKFDHAAEKAYLEALEIYRKSADDNPAVYTSIFAKTLLTVGIFYFERRNYLRSEIILKEGAEQYALVLTSPDSEVNSFPYFVNLVLLAFTEQALLKETYDVKYITIALSSLEKASELLEKNKGNQSFEVYRSNINKLRQYFERIKKEE